MARTDSTKTLWRVQVRNARGLKWRNKGLFETRAAARYMAAYMRDLHVIDATAISGYGFGNTRVIPHIRGEKK